MREMEVLIICIDYRRMDADVYDISGSPSWKSGCDCILLTSMRLLTSLRACLSIFFMSFHFVRLRHLTSGTSAITSHQDTSGNTTTQPSATHLYNWAERRRFIHTRPSRRPVIISLCIDATSSWNCWNGTHERCEIRTSRPYSLFSKSQTRNDHR